MMTQSYTEKNTILIVDDTPQSLAALKQILTDQGYKVYPAINGQIALKVAPKTLPDVILLDIVMPDMDGYEVCQRLKADKTTRDIPVLFISVLDETIEKVKAFEVGGVDYITKPFQIEEVLARVETHLALRNMQRQLQEKNVQLQQEITERKRAEDALQKHIQQLEEAHAKILRLEKETLETQMAGGFAHEIRNALAGTHILLNTVMDKDVTLCQKNADILGELFDLLKSVIPEESRDNVMELFRILDEHEESLDEVLMMIDQNTAHALKVTTLILDYARLGKTETGHERVNIQEMLIQLVQEHAAVFAEQGITLRLHGETTGILLANQSHVHAIFNNLVLNARDALLEIPDERERIIDLKVHEDVESLVVTVSDNANGIPTERLEEIYKPFYSTKPTMGIGLGLSFVSKLVPMYNGRIDIESEVGQGTRFTVTFPL